MAIDCNAILEKVCAFFSIWDVLLSLRILLVFYQLPILVIFFVLEDSNYKLWQLKTTPQTSSKEAHATAMCKIYYCLLDNQVIGESNQGVRGQVNRYRKEITITKLFGFVIRQVVCSSRFKGWFLCIKSCLTMVVMRALL